MSYAQRARQRRQFLIGSALIAFALVVMFAIAVGVLAVRRSHVSLDPATQCPFDGPRSITAIVVDRTDPISETTALDMRQVLEREVSDVPRYGAVYLFAIDRRPAAAPRPLFMRCNPGRGEEVDSLSESKKLVEREFRRSFRKPLEDTLDALQTSGTSDRSPIVETLQSVGVRAFGGSESADVPKRLVVASDFLQNSDRLSFYGANPASVLSSDAAEDLAAPLADVDVRMLFIRRDGADAAHTTALRDAWTRFFRKSGAAEIVATKLTGTDQ